MPLAKGRPRWSRTIDNETSWPSKGDLFFLRKTERLPTGVCREILETEQVYVHNLEVLVAEFVKPLRDVLFTPNQVSLGESFANVGADSIESRDLHHILQ